MRKTRIRVWKNEWDNVLTSPSLITLFQIAKQRWSINDKEKLQRGL